MTSITSITLMNIDSKPIEIKKKLGLPHKYRVMKCTMFGMIDWLQNLQHINEIQANAWKDLIPIHEDNEEQVHFFDRIVDMKYIEQSVIRAKLGAHKKDLATQKKNAEKAEKETKVKRVRKPKETKNADSPTDEVKNADSPTDEVKNADSPTDEVKNADSHTDEVKNADSPTDEVKNDEASSDKLKPADEGSTDKLKPADSPTGKVKPKDEIKSKEAAKLPVDSKPKKPRGRKAKNTEIVFARDDNVVPVDTDIFATEELRREDYEEKK